MTVTVSVSQLREDLATYIARAQSGDRVVVKDEKRGTDLVEIIGKKTFDPEAFRRALHRAAGVFTAKNHPEWATKKKVEQWLRNGRLADERHFDVYPRH